MKQGREQGVKLQLLSKFIATDKDFRDDRNFQMVYENI